MRPYRLVLFVLGLALFLGTLVAAGSTAPAAPDDIPDLVLTQATDYVIQDPKLFYLYKPLCSPIEGGEASVAESVAAGTKERGEEGGETKGPEALVTQFIGRTAVHGAAPRDMFDHTYDEFCNPPNEPDIISDIVSDDDYVYFVSNQQDALVKISENRLDWESTPPSVVYAHLARAAELERVGDHIYMLQTGFGSTGLYRINKNSGAAVPLLNGTQVGTNPNNFQTDGAYLYWRNFSAGQWNLMAYDLSSPGTAVIATDMFSYYPVAGNVVYVGFDDVIRSYSHASGSLSAPLYTSSTPSIIANLNADGSALYFIQQQVCNPACPGAYLLNRLTFGSSIPTPLYAPPSSPVRSMHNLQRHGNTLFFLHDTELKRIRANAGSAALTNMRIEGLEVTQAIQSDSNSVDLVRGKRTAVRLFASSDGADIPGVFARLYLINGSGTIIGGPLSPVNMTRDTGYMRVQSSPDKDNIDDSYTFFLPPSWVDDPTLRLRAELNPYRVPPEPTYADNVLTTSTFTMDASGRFEAHFVLFEYDSGGMRIRPRYREDYLQAVSWVRRAYPVASAPGDFTDPSPGFRPKFTWLYDADLGGNVDGSNRHPECQTRIDDGEDIANLCAAWYVVCPTLDTIRAAEALPSTIQLVGMVSDVGGFPRGWACGNGVSTPTGTATWGWDTDGSYGDWYAGHEIGHSQGRAHPTAGSAECGQSASDPSYPWPGAEIGDNTFRGFDMGDTGLNGLLVPRVYPNEWHDMMSYCDRQWISDYTYLGIKTFLEASIPAPPEQILAAGPYLQLSGVIFDGSNDVSMAQVRVWADLTNPPASGSGPYRIHLRNSGGTDLKSYDFTPHEGETAAGMVVSEFVPFDPATTVIAISHPGSGQMLWQTAISANTPTVSNVQFTAAATEAGSATLQWTAVDGDGDDMTYDVLYSRNNSATWQVLQMGLTGTSTTIDTSVLGGSNLGRFKVIAHDGVNQGEALSGVINIANKEPLLDVLNPAPGATFAFGEEVYFAAEITDYQGSFFSSNRIEWRDQTGFLLGIGSAFSQDNLLIGENIVTVTAINRDGLRATVTFSIFINDELALPAATLTAGPDQVGWHVAEGTTALQTATVQVGNSGASSMSVTISESIPWLSVSQSGSTTPLTLTFTADPRFLAPGLAFGAEVEVVGTAASGTETVTIPVSFSMGRVTGPSFFQVYMPSMLR